MALALHIKLNGVRTSKAFWSNKLTRREKKLWKWLLEQHATRSTLILIFVSSMFATWNFQFTFWNEQFLHALSVARTHFVDTESLWKVSEIFSHSVKIPPPKKKLLLVNKKQNVIKLKAINVQYCHTGTAVHRGIATFNTELQWCATWWHFSLRSADCIL